MRKTTTKYKERDPRLEKKRYARDARGSFDTS
jgi:hypothetical protein